MPVVLSQALIFGQEKSPRKRYPWAYCFYCVESGRPYRRLSSGRRNHEPEVPRIPQPEARILECLLDLDLLVIHGRLQFVDMTNHGDQSLRSFTLGIFGEIQADLVGADLVKDILLVLGVCVGEVLRKFSSQRFSLGLIDDLDFLELFDILEVADLPRPRGTRNSETNDYHDDCD